jgi:hypothetical protein
MNTKKLTAAAVVSLLTCGSAQAGTVWSGNGHEYALILSNGISWTNASSAAAALGADWHLATVTTAAEQQFIVSTFLTPNPALNGNPSIAHFWLGASDALSEGDWKWVTGESWSYNNWNTGEPNNSGNEDYLAMDARGGWKWNDAPSNLGGGYVAGYIVERNAVPEPASLVLVGTALLAAGALRRRKPSTSA